MIRDIVNDNEKTQSIDRTLRLLHRDFPQCFNAEGKFDIATFRELLNDKIDLVKEGSGFNFLGKNYASLLSSMDTTTVIVPDIEHNNKPENVNSENIYVSGDNLDALKHLVKSYAGKVKCIYIDPPYNTGTDGFVYNDKFNFTIEDLEEKLSISEEQASRILAMTTRGAASHSAWLTFMMPRLQYAKDLLSDDGVIFISIDDNEQANLKLLCDHVFGEENFLSEIIVQSNKRGQTYKQLAKTHEYLLVYTSSGSTIVKELEKELASKVMTDNISDFSERELRNRNPKYGKFNRPNLFYPIYVNPNETDKNGYCKISIEYSLEYYVEVLPLNSEGKESCWRWSKSRLLKNLEDSSMNSNVVARQKSTGTYGIYEKYRKGTYKAKTIWYDDIIIDEDDDDDEIWDEIGVITEQGSGELRKYGMGDVFDFPKPTHLIKKILTIGSDTDSICVDFFSGSGTTAESIIALNALRNGRKFIVVQLPEDLDKKLESTAKNDKPKIQKVIDFLDENKYPHTLDYIGYERIRRAAEKIKSETHADIDYGFKHYTLEEPDDNTLDRMETFNPDMVFGDDLVKVFGKETVLTTYAVRDGYGLTPKIEPLKFGNYTAYLCGKHLYMIDQGFDIYGDDLTELVDKYNKDHSFTADTVVMFGYSFNFSQTDVIKKNLGAITDRSRINIDIRY
ncbi:MAG: site-specific DNA-methyltransferase [Prevotella sp.]|nr:site-specific DNA-methyltransferase [Prevotella sp.]